VPDTTEQLAPYLHQLGWQAYLPAFVLLLQHFEGVKNLLENTDGLPVTLAQGLGFLRRYSQTTKHG
jgi:hypothetical protein